MDSMGDYDEERARATSFPPPGSPPATPGGATATLVERPVVERPAQPVDERAREPEPLPDREWAARVNGDATTRASGAGAPVHVSGEELDPRQKDALVQVAMMASRLEEDEGPSKAVSGTVVALAAMVGSLVILALVLTVAA